jgi:hypothetical protein
MKRSGNSRWKDDYNRVNITLSPEHEEFIKSMQKEIREKNGRRLPRTRIISAILEVIKSLKIDFNNIADENDLSERIMEAIDRKMK